MRESKIRTRWEQGKAVVSGWLAIGNSYSAEIVGWSGVDCVTVDLQHGMTDVQSLIGMLQAISATPATPIVRVPASDPAIIMKVLDAGAYGVICPLVESVEQATMFVGAACYPPLGFRSFGPSRGLLYGGQDYFEKANSTIIRLAMIETLPGLRAVEEILKVEGLDGIFIGPADLGIAIGTGPVAEPVDPAVLEAIDRCLQAARKVEKHIGIFCSSGAAAARWTKKGFDFVVPNHDANHLKATSAAEALAARG